MTESRGRVLHPVKLSLKKKINSRISGRGLVGNSGSIERLIRRWRLLLIIKTKLFILV